MASLQSSQTQYHHFIPQFILKNFSHNYQPQPLGSNSPKRRRKRNKKTKLYPGEPVLHIIDLKGQAPQLAESTVKRTFGLMDMYRDMSNTSDYNFLEKELSKLESRASSVIADIRKALEAGKTGFSMPRSQRDILRRFLFIMKYRGPGFHRRFHGDKDGNYKENDTDKFMLYMRKKGYQKPVDVWFESIKAILGLELDLEGKWQQKLLRTIYPDDAMWFVMHMEWYFLAFCTPSDPGDEFILTENSYNVHEGPNSTVLNPETGEYEVKAWTSYHEFGPITPKLMLILRSSLLPNAEEDANENIKTWRRNLYDVSRSSHSDPATAISTLEDLPLKKPRNSYSQVLPQGVQLLPGEDGSRRSYHRFTFQFFKINTDHVQKINTVLLENAHSTATIAFNSELSLRRALEHYLQLPADRGYKKVHCQDGDRQLAYLKQLETIAASLGSTAALIYTKVPGINEMTMLQEESLRQMQKDMLDHLPEQPSEFMRLYNILGGNRDTLFTDLEQIEKMRFLRIKIDVATKGFREATREKVRNHLRDLFCQLPARRLWMYLKTLRVMSLGTPEMQAELFASEEVMDGPEDVIVKASHVVRPECLGLLLHFTVMQDIQHRQNPGLNPSSDYDFDEAGLERLLKISRLAFAPVGSICDCGIKRIQEVAVPRSNMLRSTKLYEKYGNSVWSVDQNVEILTRLSVRKDMMSILSKEISETTLEELSDVLFNIVYPTYEKVEGLS